MTWLLPRLLMALGAALLGFVVGVAVRSATGIDSLGLGVGVVLGVVTMLLVDAVRGHRLLSWLRGNQLDNAPRDTGLWGELGYRVERAMRDRDRAVARGRLELDQFLSAIEASPNGVLMLDSQEQIVWCNRVAADHFALDPQRDLRQRITNLVRAPAFVAYLQAGRYAEPLVLGTGRAPGALSIVVREYGAGAVAGHHRARALRGDAARLRRQRLPRDPHAADRAGWFHRDDALAAADGGRA
jgi:two-component system phosphate regulon sensor histidine kinase PhoR